MDTVELQQRITEMLDRLAAVQRAGGTILIPASHCPYCSRPEGWDACPIHRNHP